MRHPEARAASCAARLVLSTCAILAIGACRRSPSADTRADGDAQAAMLASGSESAVPPPPEDAPKLGVITMQLYVHDRPTGASRRLGYLRLGARVARDEASAGNDGCPGGWYKIHPRGYVCVGDGATLDMSHPLLRAVSVRPDLGKPLPYKYGFVRAVSPLYLKVPNRKEQVASEFGLDLHMEWWRSEEGKHANDVVLGANDVPLDARGVAIPGAALGSVGKKSTDMTQGELFGSAKDDDPIPFWITGPAMERALPNVSTFQVPPKSVYANRVKRHSGLSFIGSFATNGEAFDRRFAITTDLRLVPVSKVKPDTASTWHGVEITPDMALPFAWVRMLKPVTVYRDAGGKPAVTTEKMDRRTLVHFTGKLLHGKEGLFRETEGGKWLRNGDLGIVSVPQEWPPVATTGEKWIEISIDNQTLVLWEGKKPIYATLISTGQDGMEDWKTSKATIRGTFRIRNKHVTATMDSNGQSDEGGEGASTHVEQAVSAKEGRDKGDAKRASDSSDGGDNGEPKKRGGGAFELRDVPWVEYFEAGYALHAAYWHDVFGVARSHGCVNLSPIDARRVFMWTDPPLPPEWHGVTARTIDPVPGTTVVLHR